MHMHSSDDEAAGTSLTDAPDDGFTSRVDDLFQHPASYNATLDTRALAHAIKQAIALAPLNSAAADPADDCTGRMEQLFMNKASHDSDEDTLGMVAEMRPLIKAFSQRFAVEFDQYDTEVGDAAEDCDDYLEAEDDQGFTDDFDQYDTEAEDAEDDCDDHLESEDDFDELGEDGEEEYEEHDDVGAAEIQGELEDELSMQEEAGTRAFAIGEARAKARAAALEAEALFAAEKPVIVAGVSGTPKCPVVAMGALAKEFTECGVADVEQSAHAEVTPTPASRGRATRACSSRMRVISSPTVRCHALPSRA
jgi:hypothetical protein